MKDKKTYGTLYLIPTPIGNTSPLDVLPPSIKKVIEGHCHFIVESEKEARRFIKRIAPNKDQGSLHLYPLNKFTSQIEIENYLVPCKKGISMGLFSDTGCPVIADPGSNIIQLAHKNGIAVKPLVGPSSITLAIMASGMNGQSFAFNGYLPINEIKRKKSIQQFETIALKSGQSQIFIETPYRNEQVFKDLVNTLNPNTLLSVSCDLTLKTEYIETKTITLWKKTSLNIQKRPAVFIVGSSLH